MSTNALVISYQQIMIRCSVLFWVVSESFNAGHPQDSFTEIIISLIFPPYNFSKPILINCFKFSNEIPFERAYSTEIDKSFPMSYSWSSLINISSAYKIFQKSMKTFFVKIDKMLSMMFLDLMWSTRKRKVSEKFVLYLNSRWLVQYTEISLHCSVTCVKQAMIV